MAKNLCDLLVLVLGWQGGDNVDRGKRARGDTAMVANTKTHVADIQPWSKNAPHIILVWLFKFQNINNVEAAN